MKTVFILLVGNRGPMDDKKMIEFVTRRDVTVVSFNEALIYGVSDVEGRRKDFGKKVRINI